MPDLKGHSPHPNPKSTPQSEQAIVDRLVALREGNTPGQQPRYLARELSTLRSLLLRTKRAIRTGEVPFAEGAHILVRTCSNIARLLVIDQRLATSALTGGTDAREAELNRVLDDLFALAMQDQEQE